MTAITDMERAGTAAVCGILAYLIGAVPSGFLIARARGVDIRRVGSGNIGATNVFRCVGKPWGLLTFAADMLKGFVPAFALPRLAAALGGAENGPAVGVACACLAVAGHNWPVYLGFKGGKGVATSAGAVLGVAPAAVGIGLAVWAVVFLATRYVSVASLVTAAALGAAAWPLYRREGLLLPSALTLLALLIVARHHGNIRRLIQGTEHRFAFRRKEG